MYIRTVPESVWESFFLAAVWQAGHRFLPAHVTRDVADVLGYNLGTTGVMGWIRFLPTVIHTRTKPRAGDIVYGVPNPPTPKELPGPVAEELTGWRRERRQG